MSNKIRFQTTTVMFTLFLAAMSAAQSFAPPVVYPNGNWTTEMISGDWNGDGAIDIASCYPSSNGGVPAGITLRFNLGGGIVSNAISATTTGVDNIATADIDGDGDLDLVASYKSISNAVGGHVHVYYGDGNGIFAEVNLQNSNPLIFDGNGTLRNSEIKDVGLEDVNGDQLPDLIVLEEYATGFTVFLNQGGSIPFPASSSQVYDLDLYSGPEEMAFMDYDGDGDSDILIVRANTNWNMDDEVIAIKNDGLGGFGSQLSPALFSLSFVAFRVKQIATGDFDGNGLLDIVTGSNNQAITILRNFGNGLFISQTYYEPSGIWIARELDVSDLDNDGDMDVVLANNAISTQGATLFVNDGSGCFSVGSCPAPGAISAGQYIPVGFSTCRSMVIEDLDGDGSSDLVFGSDGNPDISVLINLTATLQPAAYPGNAVDFWTDVTINGALSLNPTRVFSLTAGSNVALKFSSPGGTLYGQPFTSMYQVQATGTPLASQVIPGDMAPQGFWLVNDGSVGLFPLIDGFGFFASSPAGIAPTLPYGGANIGFVIPLAAAGMNLSVFIQTVILSPGLNSLNYGLSNCKELRIL